MTTPVAQLDVNESTGEVQRTLHFTSLLDEALGLNRFRLRAELKPGTGYTLEHLVPRRTWYAPWRITESWEPLLLVNRTDWCELRFQTPEQARSWLRFNVARTLNPYPVC